MRPRRRALWSRITGARFTKPLFLETDPVKLDLRVKAVEDAIRARQSLDGEGSTAERAAMKDTLDSLGVLKLEWDKRKK